MPLQYSSGIVTKPPNIPINLPAGTTSLITLLPISSGTAKRGVFVHEMLIVNSNAGAQTVVIDIYDGTTSWPLIPGKSIAAKDYLPFTHEFSLDQDSTKTITLRATPSVATDITVHITLSQKP